LEHFEKQLLETMGRKVHVIFLAGGDLIESFGVKGLWDTDDLHNILNNYECCIVERNGTDLDNLLFNSDILYQYKKNIHVIKQPIQNDISSSKIRLMIKREKSVKYLLPDSVNKYIRDNNLFKK
jgi:nicotinamide mononucleotide adenylyltransferase